MTDDSYWHPHNAWPSTANGHTRLHKQPPKKLLEEHSPRNASRQAGRLPELEDEEKHKPQKEKDERKVIEDEKEKNKQASLAGLKHGFSTRRTSGGFLMDADRRKKQRLASEPEAVLDETPKGNGRLKTPDTSTRDEDARGTVRRSDKRPRPNSSSAGAFLAHDIAPGEASYGRRGVNFKDRRSSSPEREMSSSPGPSQNRSQRSSTFQTPPRASIVGAHRKSTESPGIDPSQIVRMALNLSEGRRMHLEPGQVPSIPNSVENRTMSATIPTKARQHSPNNRSSLRGSNTKTPSPGRMTPNGLKAGALSTSSKSSTVKSAPLLTDEEPIYSFSPSTVTRADRAKAYFELADQHRRLLGYLPPLKHDHREETGQENHLGRQYNPIQFLRNRETRASSRATFDADKAGWTDVPAVAGWVDSVESEAGQDGYVEGDVAHLPRWATGTGTSTIPQTEQRQRDEDAVKQRRLQFTRSLWSTDPSELLADAYWLEQNDHKRNIRNKHGHPIFRNFSAPTRRRAGTGTSAKTQGTRYSGTSDEDERSPKSLRTATVSGDSYEDLPNSRQGMSDVGFSPPHKSKTSRVKRRLLRKNKHESRKDQTDSGDDSELSVEGFPSRRGPKSNNIGPLERHMKKMIEKEQQLGSPVSSPIDSQATHDSPRSPEERRRGGISEESPQLERYESIGEKRKSMQGAFRFPALDSKRDSSTDTPRISVEDTNNDTRRDIYNPQANGHATKPNQKSSGLGEPAEIERITSRASRLGFFKKHRAELRPATAETDFAHGKRERERRSVEGQRSITSASDSGTEDGFHSPVAAPDRRGSSDSLVQEGKKDGERSPTSKHFFRAGRIGEIMRLEKPPANLQGPPTSPRAREYASSDTDSSRSRSRDHKHHKSTGGAAPTSSRRPGHGRSQSSSSHHRGRSSRQPQYHIQNLPSFVPSNVSPEKDRKAFLSPYGDHISHQQRDRAAKQKHSRLKDLAPPSIETSDVSPTTSAPDLTRNSTRATTAPTDESSHRPTTRDESVSGSQTRDQSRHHVMERLDNALGSPGQLGKGLLPPTGLSSLHPRLDPVRRPQVSSHDTDKSFMTPVALRRHQGQGVTRQNIAYVRTMLLTSGVKAATIMAMANAPRDRLPEHIIKALRTAGKDPAAVGRVTRQQEHALAARSLSSHLQSSMTAFDNSAMAFRNSTCHKLNARIDDLRDLVSNHLTHQVHEEGDRADGFVAQLTTTHTLSIKQVNDSVDLMLRKRRQRLRWLRRAGFGILEWLLVGIMWGIWVVVFATGLVRRALALPVRFVRFMLFID